MIDSYIDFWRRWKDFSGKTSRYGFWTAILTHIIVSFILRIVGAVLIMFTFDLTPEDTMRYFDILWSVYGIIWTVPMLAMTVRRLHDAGYSAKSFLWLLIPGLGGIAFFARLVTQNNDSDNL